MPVVELTSPTNVFDVAVFHQLGPALRDFIATRRWFRAKTRTIQNVTVEDVIPANAPGCYFLITRIHYRDGESDRYAIDTRIGELSFGDAPTGRDPEPSGDVIATYRTGNGGQGNISTALPDAAFRNALLDAVFCGRIFTGNSGEWIASRTAAASQNASNANLPSSVSRAEQSNTSIIYSDRFILKLFRKIEPGINPDLEISEFLTSRGFAHTPAVLGKFEYRKNGGPNYAAGILQQFVPNRGDAWKYTLESLADFFQRAAAHGDPPQIPLPNPSATAGPETPELVTELLGTYRASADLLGRRTAQMHAALADPEAGPDFAPEPFTSADARQLCVEMMGQADIAFELLRRKQAALTGSAAENARAVLHVEQRVAQHFSALQDHAITAARIR
ncbi:MAG: hypothetical protein JO211_00225, partial [Acidobacteriaceae bacterium]|nr:hypothetical protein [Acidobacteriaceae bacterium]